MRINFEYATNKITPREFQEQTKYILGQAKEMEKEQLESAYWEGGQDVPMSGKQCEQYYNETYGGNK
jgi:hypothetical protein